jgi:hypothetical protein
MAVKISALLTGRRCTPQKHFIYFCLGFDSRRHQIFLVAVGLERGPLSPVRINEELLERKSSGSGLESWD